MTVLGRKVVDSGDRQEKSNKLRDLKAAKSLRMYNLNVGNKDEGRWKMMFKFSSWEMGWMVSGTNYCEGTDLIESF